MSKSILLLTPDRWPAVRVVYFPYAGGNAAQLRSWASLLPQHVELVGVRYPGAGAASGKRTPRSIADRVCDDIAALAQVPLIFFGYSLGALVAYEVGRAFAHRGFAAPAHFVAAASRAPHLPRRQPPISGLPDHELIEQLRLYGGTPEAVLQDQEAIEYLLPLIRDDLSVAEHYLNAEPEPLDCPITAIAGRSDALMEIGDVAAWNEQTRGSFAFHQMEGGHFFLHEQSASVAGIVRMLAERHR